MPANGRWEINSAFIGLIKYTLLCQINYRYASFNDGDTFWEIRR